MGRTWPVAFPTSATTWISHVTIVRIHVRLLMSDCVRLMIDSDRSGRRIISTNRPPSLNQSGGPLRDRVSPTQDLPTRFLLSLNTPRPPENYAKTKNYNKKTQWKENVETGQCPINRFSRKISKKKFNFQYLKKVQRSKNQILKTQWVMG